MDFYSCLYNELQQFELKHAEGQFFKRIYKPAAKFEPAKKVAP
jgi:hypothetical protein